MTLDVHELAKLPFGQAAERIAQYEQDNMPEFRVSFERTESEYQVIRAFNPEEAKRKAEVILDEEYDGEWEIISVTEIKE